MPHVAELSYPGRWLDHEDHEWSLRVESRFHHLERFLAEAAISLDLFVAATRRREQGRDRRLPEAYAHLVPYVHARAFVGAMDDIGRWLAALEGEEGSAPWGGEYGMLGCALLRIAEVDGPPRAGMLVLEEREGRWLALRFAGDRPREVEVSEESLFAARDRVQAAIRALPWRGPCRRVP